MSDRGKLDNIEREYAALLEHVFDAAFVALARDVYRTNDQRMSIKREINDLLGSDLVEEKEYQKY